RSRPLLPGNALRRDPYHRGPHSFPTRRSSDLFAFGHTAPHSEFDSIVERIRETFEPDRTAAADLLRIVLFSPLHEQCVGVALLAERLGRPVDQQSHLHDLPVRFSLHTPRRLRMINLSVTQRRRQERTLHLL